MGAPDRRATLTAGLEALAIHADEGQIEGLLRYVDLLHRWNAAYNLSAVRDPDEMLPRHLLDSLAALPYVEGPRVLDLGSGAGLPGIPLAVMRPAWQVVLLDGNGKKARFLRQAKLELALANVEVIHGRAEQISPEGAGFDSVTARAVARLDDLVRLCRPLIRPEGRLVALKGPSVSDELPALQGGLRATDHRVAVPGLEGERHIIIVTGFAGG